MNDTDTELLTEFRSDLQDFRIKINSDVLEKLKRHETECNRSILQRTSRGPLGVGPGDGRSNVATSTRTPLLADNEQFRSWLSQPRNHRSNFVCEVALPPPTERRALAPILNAGATTYMGGVWGPPPLPLRVAELLPRIPVPTGAAVSWTKETAFTPGATVVPEGALKPTSNLTFLNIITPFSTIANFTKSSVQSLQDVPQLQSWIDQRLTYAVELAQEGILLHDPASGLLAAAQPLDAGYTPTAPATVLDTIGSAISQLSAGGYSVDGIVMSGADVNAARLLKSTQGEYLWASPDSLLGVMAMWGVPLVISPSLTAGQYLVGAFAQSTILFDRQVLQIDISYENEDDFVRNLATIRGELRSALAIPVPHGLITGTLTAGMGTAARK